MIAGTGANSTAEAIALTALREGSRRATAACRSSRITTSRRRKGCTGTFATIAEKVDLPLMLYNVPGRTVADLANDTMLRLADVPGIVGHQGRNGGPGPRQRADPGAEREGQARFRGLQRRGHHGAAADADGRPWRDLGHRQRRAEADGRDVPGGAGRRLRDRARAATTACCRCTAGCSSRRTRSPSSGRSPQMGLIENELRLPLVPLSPQFNETVRAALREAGCLS